MGRNGFLRSNLMKPQVLVIVAILAVVALAWQAKPATRAFGQPLPNPPFPDSCSLDIALVLDSSSSIDSTELATMKTAMIGFVNAFVPATDTEFSVITFSGLATDVGPGWSGSSTTVDGWINSITSGSNTNWEQGLLAAYNAFPNRVGPDFPNLVIFASDGNPNHIGNPAVSVSQTAAVEAAIVQANAIKSDLSARIIAIGIGNNLNTGNLEAISSADAVVTSAFDTLAADLAAIVQQACGGDGPGDPGPGDPGNPGQICVNGRFVTAQEGLTATNDCGAVRLCVDGQSVTVSQFEADNLLDDGATRGSCVPAEGPPPPTPIPPTPVPPAPTQEVLAAVATPTPVAVVKSVTPPSTGDGGLRDQSGTTSYQGVAAAFGLLGLLTLVLRRGKAQVVKTTLT
jgi:von Willebrand factor type A domain